MIKRPDTNAQRMKRHKRVRSKISGTPEIPRLNVFRSESNIYAQIIDDVSGKTLASASSLDKRIKPLRDTAAMPPQLPQWASCLLSAPRQRASRTWSLTAEDTFTMAVCRHWPRAPARVA